MIHGESGRPLDSPVRSFFEARFDKGLGHVRVHTGARADASARALDAEAYSVGPNLVFRSGRYAPGTKSGRQLLAHELAHTFQSPPTVPRRAVGYPVAQAEAADERRAADAADAALSSSPPSEAWKLAVDSAGSPAAGTVRRQESEGLRSGIRSGAERFGTWVEETASDVSSAVGEEFEEAGEVLESGVELAREGFASIVERVSPFLARMVREGPITVLTEWIGERLGAWLQSLLGDFSPGQLVTDLGRWLGSFVSAVGEDIRAEGGLGCWLFARVVDLFASLGRAILDNPVTQAIGSALSAAHDVVAEVVGLWVQAGIRQIVALWDGLRELGSTVRGWLRSIRSYSERAVDWVIEELGLGGEGGVISRLQDLANSAWRTIRDEVAPAALTALREAGRALYSLSGLKGAAASIAAAQELWTAIQWLWEHRDDPNLVAEARENPTVRDTFLPGALESIQGFADSVAGHVEWLHRQLSSLVDAVESAVGPLEDLPVIRTLAPLLRSLAKGLRALWTRVSKELPRFSKWIRKAAAAVWDVGKKILAVWAVLFILGLNPWLIPFVIVGLFALGAWLLLPDCYKEPVIDLILDTAITALRVIPDLPLFGPLWSLLKPGFTAFLERAKGWDRERKVAVTERIAKLMLWSGPDFALGWVWGVLKGFWEALTDVFVMVWMALKGLSWLTQWADRMAREALELPPRPEPGAPQPAAQGAAPETPEPTEDAARSPQAPASVLERLRRFVDEVRGPVGEIEDNFMEAVREHFRGRPGRTFDVLQERLGELWDRAQESIEEQGASLADRTADAILSPEAEELSGEMAFNIGEFIGWLAATIFAEILLAVVSAGIIPVARSVKWIVNAIDFVGDVLFGWVFRLIAKLGGMVLRLGRRLASMSGTVGGALGRVIRAIDTVGAAIRRLAGDVIQAFRPAGRGAAEAAAGRGGRESLEAGSGRIEAEPRPRQVAEAERRAAGRPTSLRELLERAGQKDALTDPAEIAAEHRWIAENAGRRQPSSLPGYVQEITLPSGHIWRQRPDGRWCRFSKKGVCHLAVPEGVSLTPDESEFLQAYTRRFPHTGQSVEELLRKYRSGLRMDPRTGWLHDPSRRKKPDETAEYFEETPEIRIIGPAVEEERIIAPREDEETAGIDALLRERDEMRARRDRARAAGEKDEANRLGYQVIERSRLIGEIGSARYVRQEFPGAELIYPKGAGSRSGDFDQVWKWEPPDAPPGHEIHVVIEAKGGRSRLKSRRTAEGVRAEQGTPEYFNDIIRAMKASGDEDMIHAARRLEAGDPVDIHYIEARVPIRTEKVVVGETGSAAVMLDTVADEIRVRRFDLSPSRLSEQGS